MIISQWVIYVTNSLVMHIKVIALMPCSLALFNGTELYVVVNVIDHDQGLMGWGYCQ